MPTRPPAPTRNAPAPESLFPGFQAYVRATRLDERATGNLSVAVARILGQGRTKAIGLDAPPSSYERRVELAKIELPAGEVLPPDAAADVRQASEDLKRLHRLLAVEEERRRFANDSLTLLAEPVGYTSGYFHAGPLILTHRRQGTEWQWSVTPHYPLVSRLPPDPQYIALAYGVALQQMKALTLPTDVFGRRLRMAWMLARHFAANEDVPVSSVMKMYQIAGQDDSFWQSPRRNLYRDLPEAAFVINILSWRRQAADVSGFEFVPATLAQATQKDVFFMPMNVAGTEVRPMIYLRYRPQA